MALLTNSCFCRIISLVLRNTSFSYTHVKYLVDDFMCFCLLLLTSLVFAENNLSKGPGLSFVRGTSLDVRRWSTCAVFEDFLEELAFGKELLEEESSETNACVDIRSGLLNPPLNAIKVTLQKLNIKRPCN